MSRTNFCIPKNHFISQKIILYPKKSLWSFASFKNHFVHQKKSHPLPGPPWDRNKAFAGSANRGKMCESLWASPRVHRPRVANTTSFLVFPLKFFPFPHPFLLFFSFLECHLVEVLWCLNAGTSDVHVWALTLCETPASRPHFWPPFRTSKPSWAPKTGLTKTRSWNFITKK